MQSCFPWGRHRTLYLERLCLWAPKKALGCEIENNRSLWKGTGSKQGIYILQTASSKANILLYVTAQWSALQTKSCVSVRGNQICGSIHYYALRSGKERRSGRRLGDGGQYLATVCPVSEWSRKCRLVSRFQRVGQDILESSTMVGRCYLQDRRDPPFNLTLGQVRVCGGAYLPPSAIASSGCRGVRTRTDFCSSSGQLLWVSDNSVLKLLEQVGTYFAGWETEADSANYPR